MRFEQFCGGSYASSLTVDSERSINWFPRKVEAPGGKAQFVLESTPGYALACSVGGVNEHIIGVAAANGSNYIATVDGATARLYSLTKTTGWSANLVTSWALNVVAGTNACSTLLWSGKEFLVMARGGGYLYNPTTSTTTTLNPSGSSAGFPHGSVCSATVSDGYFVVACGQTSTTGIARNQFWVSGVYDGTTWSALNVGVARGSGDTIQHMIGLHRELWIFGESHAEIYYDAGTVAGTTFPWARNNSVYLEVGCNMPGSLTRVADTLAWVGADSNGWGVVYLLNGYSPQRISTHVIERALQTVNPDKCPLGYAMQREGHPCYVLTIPTVTTFVYDLSTGLWHEWLNWSGSAYTPHLLSAGAFVFNGSYVAQLGWRGSSGTTGLSEGADNQLYLVSNSSLTDNGAAIKRTRRAPHLVGEQKRLRYSQFALDCNVGVQADSTAQSGTVSLNLSWSDDGGNTFNTPQSVSLPAGNYTTRPVWRRLGLARDRVFEVTTTSAYNVTLNNAFLELEAGTS
jgi:hypothetical protein